MSCRNFASVPEPGGRGRFLSASLNKNNYNNKEQDLCLYDLDNDSLALILEYLDFSSCIRFANLLSHKWRARCHKLVTGYLGDCLFARHGFSPEDVTTTTTTTQDKAALTSSGIDQVCKARRQMDQALCSSPTNKKNPFPLRNDCFGFAAVVPDDWDFSHDADPPPVSFDCDSFWLSSSGSSGELLFLNPFSTRLVIWDNVLHHSLGYYVANVHEETAESQLFWQPPPPKQVLFDTSDYFGVDLRDYFPVNAANNPRNGNLSRGDEQEFELSYIGVEAKPLLSKNEKTGSICANGTMVTVGRILTREEDGVQQDGRQPEPVGRNDDENWYCVTELCSWFRLHNDEDDYYKNQHICRFRGGFRTLDVCSNKRCVYVNPWAYGSGEWVMGHDPDQPVSGQERVLVYPMVQKRCQSSSSNSTEGNFEYFPISVAILDCKEAVTAVKTSSLGNKVLIATILGNVQLWDVQDLHKPRLLYTVSCFRDLRAAYRRAGRGNVAEEDETTSFPTPMLTSHPSAAEEIYVSRHLPIEQAGFVTLQHSLIHGSSLLLWKCVDQAWSVQARVDLPLSSSRFPKVHFDGRKIIVLGQDHIGILLLVYQVYYSNEDLGAFAATERVPAGVASSGGVVNFGSTPSLRFTKRIRHAALGGFQPYDPLHMTCNERFIVVATKTGQFADPYGAYFSERDNGAVVYSVHEGLLVIDLQQQHKETLP